MQIMNVKKLLKRVWNFLAAPNTINNIPDAVITIDKQGNLTGANKVACKYFGLKKSEIEETRIEDFIKKGLEFVQIAIEGRHPVVVEAERQNLPFFAELNASKQKNGYIITIRDLTKLTNQKQIEEKVARFNGEKNAMLVKLEGDLKGPLTSILGFSQGLIDGIGGNLTEKQAKYINIINSSSNDLYNFIDKFLEFTYAESSLYEADNKNFDIVELVKTVVKDSSALLQNKNIQLEINYDFLEKRTIYSDFKAIHRAIKNILEVSIKTTDSGHINLVLSPLKEEEAISYGINKPELYMSVTIKDTGTGFDAGELKYLCDPYFQLEKGKKNLMQAFKLGSASILIRRAGGYIDINSILLQETSYKMIIPIEKS